MPGQGALLGQRYRLDERIGSGAMGEVWRGTDTALERTIAVKVVRPELLAEPSFRERFLSEARTMARIRHPGVVAVHDYHSDAELAFLVMQYVPGESLAQLLHRSGRLDPGLAMALLAQAGEALQAAHDTGVVHRDVKPGNLLVTPEGAVVLTDFGIARSAASAPLTTTGALLGTVAYLAPEQVLGQPATPRSDGYALGVVAYECLAGHRPFDGDNPHQIALARVHQAPPPLPDGVPAAVRAVVERALAADPERRWPSAAELAAAARQAAPPATPPPEGTHPPPPVAPVAGPPPGYPPPGYPSPGHPPAGYPPPAYPAAGYLAPAPPPHRPPGQQNVFGLLGLIFGILSIVFSVCCSLVGLPLGVAGAVLGGIGIRRASDGLASNRGMALAGLICGVVGAVLSVGIGLLGTVGNLGVGL